MASRSQQTEDQITPFRALEPFPLAGLSLSSARHIPLVVPVATCPAILRPSVGADQRHYAPRDRQRRFLDWRWSLLFSYQYGAD